MVGVKSERFSSADVVDLALRVRLFNANLQDLLSFFVWDYFKKLLQNNLYKVEGFLNFVLKCD